MVLETVDIIIAGIFIVANHECYHCCYTNCSSIYNYVYLKAVFFVDISSNS